jgi:hypothetical protein
MKARTMVYLDAQELEQLRAEARKQKISLAEIMRRLVKQHLAEGAAPLALIPPESYLKIVALGASGRQDISERHDTYLAEALRREHAG